jgi:predicted nuclease of restriction endonuclease-like (RecB) superfamily
MSEKKLHLTTGRRFEIKGEGDSLKIVVRAFRVNKAKRYEVYEIELDVGRWTIQQFARQIATMHERDRERLRRETARIERELEAIKQPETAG